jgi:hypothetical protein
MSGTISGKASADAGKVLQGITVKLYDDQANFMVLKHYHRRAGEFLHSSGLASGNYYIAATITVGGDCLGYR